MSQVTADHSLAEERVRHGEITEAGGGRPPAAPHPDPGPRGVARRGDRHVGAPAADGGPPAPVQRRAHERDRHGRDGRGAARESPIRARRRRQLVDAANSHGGADNITVVRGRRAGGRGHDRFDLCRDAAPHTGGRGPARGRSRAVGRPPATDGENGSGSATGGDDVTEMRDPAPPPPSGAADRHASMIRSRRWSRRSTTRWRPARGSASAPTASLAESGPRSDEFFLGAVGSASPAGAGLGPRASRTERAGGAAEGEGEPARPPPAPRDPAPHHVRVVLFVLLVAAVPVAAYYVLRWYAYDNWTVTSAGQPGGGGPGPDRRRAVVQAEGGGPHRRHHRPDPPAGGRGHRQAGVQESSLANARTTSRTWSANTTNSTRRRRRPPPRRPRRRPHDAAAGGSTTTTGAVPTGLPRREAPPLRHPTSTVALPRWPAAPSVGSWAPCNRSKPRVSIRADTS